MQTVTKMLSLMNEAWAKRKRGRIPERSLEIPFSSPQLARVAYDVMRVDKEPKRSCTRRTVTVEDSILHVNFQSSDIKNLRVAANSFFKHLILVNETIDIFGPEVASSYDHY